LLNIQNKKLINGQYDFAFGITNGITSDINKMLSSKIKICPVPRMVKVLRIESYLKSKLSLRWISAILAPVINTLIKKRYTLKINPLGNIRISKVTSFDNRFDIFWKKIKQDYPIMTVRDSAYLNWRFVEEPNMNFFIFCAESTKTNELLGYIVINIKNENIPKGYIYDIVTPKDSDPNVIRCLLKHAVDLLEMKKVAAIECWMFDSCHMHNELIKFGFISRNKNGFDLYFQNLHRSSNIAFDKAVENGKNWFISRCDADP
jgi:hypothetical protein